MRPLNLLAQRRRGPSVAAPEVSETAGSAPIAFVKIGARSTSRGAAGSFTALPMPVSGKAVYVSITHKTPTANPPMADASGVLRCGRARSGHNE